MQHTIQNPYESCPVYETEHFLFRFVQLEDAQDLLECYSDLLSALIFNSDNCTSNFIYHTTAEMTGCILFWLEDYRRGGYVRFSIVDRARQVAIGTIECFARPGIFEPFGKVGMLRVDLASPYERVDTISKILDVIHASFFDLFGVNSMITKAIPAAQERIAALQQAGYWQLEDNIILPYGDYWVRMH
jgi:[ribosomal protein S5]-alanine N-acetyltransferase